jgi:DNA-binding NarL/FixJ family response regulator
MRALGVEMVRIFLVDDHEITRKGLRVTFEAEEDMEVVGEAATAAEALDRIPAAMPQVAILDVRLPDGSGIEVCRESRSADPKLVCLMLTSFSDDEALFAAIMAGAAAYVLKDVRSNELVSAVRSVADGQSLIDPALTQSLFDQVRSGASPDPRMSILSDQELRILDLIVEGKTNREIAAAVFLADKTVKNYVSKLLRKLGMHHRTEAAVFRVRTGRGTPSGHG